MTDARGFIAHQIPGSSAEVCFGLADAIIAALHAAGFRVLGPAEVDQVTLEKAIAIVEAAAPTATGEWNVHRAWALSSIPSLRALGRKA